MLPDDIQKKIRAEFETGLVQFMERELEAFVKRFQEVYQEPPTPRIIRCVVYLTAGEKENLSHFVEAALKDWRDVIYWAEYNAEDQRIHDFNEPFKLTADG